ncbi:MAG TPA: DUF433 domain-containing protein [Thermoanaerobaculia bacterium]|nr:DUF433 domain-containing protein [Thermoanaerobaculia bacterium]
MVKKKRPEIAPGITVDRDEGFGAPVVKGTAVEVASVLDELAAGMKISTLEREYGLSREGILAALAYASEVISELPQARSGECVEVTSSLLHRRVRR